MHEGWCGTQVDAAITPHNWQERIHPYVRKHDRRSAYVSRVQACLADDKEWTKARVAMGSKVAGLHLAVFILFLPLPPLQGTPVWEVLGYKNVQVMAPILGKHVGR